MRFGEKTTYLPHRLFYLTGLLDTAEGFLTLVLLYQTKLKFKTYSSHPLLFTKNKGHTFLDYVFNDNNILVNFHAVQPPEVTATPRRNPGSHVGSTGQEEILFIYFFSESPVSWSVELRDEDDDGGQASATDFLLDF